MGNIINKPKLRFPEFSESWSIKGLGELLEFKNGINASKEQYGKGVKFINVLDILNNNFITYDKILGSVDVDEKVIENYSVRYGDILFQRSSETREEVGTACVYLDKVHSATFGGFVIRGKKIGIYDPVFLNMLLKTNAARDAITSQSGGSTRYNVGQGILTSINLFYPDLSEQQKIGLVFSTIDERLQILNKKKSLLEQYKKGAMHQLFSQELRFMDEDGNDFPDWEEKLFDKVVKAIPSKKYQIKSTEIRKSGTFRVIDQGKDLIAGYSDSEELLFKDLPIILFGDHTTILKYVDFNFIVGADGTKLLKCVSDYPQFIYFYLCHNRIEQEGYKRHFSKLSELIFHLPSLPEQVKIASFLSALDDKIAQTALQIEKMQIWKKGLLQQMFV